MGDGTFDAAWLALRERADHRSRVRGLLHRLRREGRRQGWSRLVDLGSGTGSNLRYVAARLPWAREWTLVDHDPALVDGVASPFPGVNLRRVVADLRDDGLGEVDGHHVVTASALLDLVSEPWLQELRDRCVDVGAGAYFVLSYDGSIGVEDGGTRQLAEVDTLVRDAVNEHQLGDKGLGDALGPQAGAVAADLFAEAGYRVWSEPSPWRLEGRRDRALIEALVEGWVEAAVELRPSDEERIQAWGQELEGAARTESVAVTVGHLDVLALPPDPGALARDP